MRAGALSADAWNLGSERPIAQTDKTLRNESALSAAAGWNATTFADEQVRGLVRRVFSPALSPRVHQVVFCPVERETDVRSLCEWVGEILAEENSGDVAVLDESESCSDCGSEDTERQKRQRPKSAGQFARRVRKNLWTFPGRRPTPDLAQRLSLSAYLGDMRREFEYSIVAASAPTVSSAALEIASLADGLVLVLSAQRTRRVTAVRVRNAFTNVRLLGAVLTDREFPMPARIYRRL